MLHLQPVASFDNVAHPGQRGDYHENGLQVAGLVQRLEDVTLQLIETLFRDRVEALHTLFAAVAEGDVQRDFLQQFMLEQARKDAEIEVARAKGAAEAQAIVRATLSDSYLQYLWIKTLSENPNVIYVATEANLPIFKQTD